MFYISVSGTRIYHRYKGIGTALRRPFGSPSGSRPQLCTAASVLYELHPAVNAHGPDTGEGLKTDAAFTDKVGAALI